MSNTSVKVIPFDGTQEGYPMWAMKFKGYMGLLDCGDILSRSNLNDVPDADTVKMNDKAYYHLLMAVNDKPTFNIIKNSKSTHLKQCAYTAWKAIQAKWEPKEDIDMQQLTGELFNSRLEDVSKDPVEWIDEIEDMKLRLKEMGENVSDNIFITHILHHLPSEYETVVDLISNDKNKNLDDIKKRLKAKYERMKTKESFNDEDDKALTVKGNFKKFSGRCNYCGKQGHKSADCYTKKKDRESNNNPGGGNNKRRRFTGKCHNCGKIGHKAADCRSKSENKKNNNNNNEEAQTATHLLMAYDTDVDGALIPDSFFDRFNYMADDACDFDTDTEEELGHDFGLGVEGKSNSNFWIADTGATAHLTASLNGMYDLTDAPSNDGVRVGNNATLKVTKIGKWTGEYQNADGNTELVTLQQVKYVPGLAYNLFSITSAIKKGAKLFGEDKVITIKHGQLALKFGEVRHTRDGYLLGLTMNAATPTTAAVGMQPGTKIKASELHGKLGHTNDAYMRKTAKLMGLEVTGKLGTCENCAIGKSKQKSVPKESSDKDMKPGELLYMDTSSVKEPSHGGKLHWILFVDAKTDCCISRFVKRKSSLRIVGLQVLRELKAKGIAVKRIRCDNAGENKQFDRACNHNGWSIQFEYTAPGTPQQNGKVERKFATLMGMVRSMNNAARFDKKTRAKLWAEACNTATDMINIIVSDDAAETPHKQFYGKEAQYVRHLRTFGEVGVARNIETVKGKLEDRGTPCIFLGYAAQHAGDVYRMLSLTTNKIRLSRDVTWLNKSYGEYKGITRTEYIRLPNGEEYYDDDILEDSNNTENNAAINEAERNTGAGRNHAAVPGTTRSGKNFRNETTESTVTVLPKEVRGLRTFYNEMGSAIVNDPEAELAMILIDMSFEKEMSVDISEGYLFAAINESQPEPRNFQEAWNHSDPIERARWRTAIRKEFKDMIRCGVWRKMKKAQVPSNRRLVGSKWVFKKKKDGRYRARLVALGYSQVPGEDYTDTHSPVVNDITFRIILVLMLIFGWETDVVDVTTAFLLGKMEEEVYMTVPEGLELVEDGWDIDEDCVQLLQTIYGTKQASRQYWKHFMSKMKKKGFMISLIDPCLLMRKDNNGTVIIGVYVDDCLFVGDRKAVDAAKNEVAKMFEVRKLGPLDEYIGCTVKRIDKNKLGLIQPDMINKLDKDFGPEVKNVREAETPMGPGVSVERPKENDEKLSKAAQKRYRSAVGMLLYLVKHSRPDLSNAVRELAKVMDGATVKHEHMMRRVVKYVLATRKRGVIFKIHDVGSISVEALCDSDYGGDKDNRRSVTGYIIFLCGCPIVWKSKQQGGVTLSSSEAEYYAISEVAAELLFVKQILEFLEVDFKMPMKIRVDNNGAIYLANNASSGNRTKHVDTRVHFVRELIQSEPKVVDTEFVKSEDNTSDTFTKNVTNELFWKHTGGYMNEVD